MATLGLMLAASATGMGATSPAQNRHTQGAIEALAIDGNRIAYDVGSTLGKNNNKVLVWNVRTGKTTTVSGKRTRTVDDSSTGSGVFQLAIAGARIAWLANVGGNSEGDDYLFSSSVTTPKERKLSSVMRSGDSCAGRSPKCAGAWLGGLVGSGSSIALNRWTTDDSGNVVGGGLYLLNGARLTSIANDAGTVEAASVDEGRVTVLRLNGGLFGENVAVYSSAGKQVWNEVVPDAEAVALSGHGHQLAALTTTGKLEIWKDYRTPKPPKTFHTHGSRPPQDLDVQGDVAIYSAGTSLHAVNLSSGKDRVIGTLGAGIGSARIGGAGVVYSSNRLTSKGTLVFLPWATVSAAVG